jgi:hypothetical protein
MEHSNETMTDQPEGVAEASAIAPSQETNSGSMASPTCPACGSAPGSQKHYVYAVGRIESRFPSPAVEKEFAQLVGRADSGGLTDRQVLHSILSKRENRYLARQMCWVFTIEGMETYLLVPRDAGDFDLLIESIRSAPSPMDIDAVIGVRGPIAPPEMCNGLMIPIVAFDQVYSFDRDALIKSIPKPEKVGAKEFATAAEGLLDRIMQMADNAGATDEHRALNYCALRYPEIYVNDSRRLQENSSLSAVEVRPSRLSGVRKVVDMIFSYRNRSTDVSEKFFVRVDVTEEFPFLVTKMSPYYDR